MQYELEMSLKSHYEICDLQQNLRDSREGEIILLEVNLGRGSVSFGDLQGQDQPSNFERQLVIGNSEEIFLRVSWAQIPCRSGQLACQTENEDKQSVDSANYMDIGRSCVAFGSTFLQLSVIQITLHVIREHRVAFLQLMLELGQRFMHLLSIWLLGAFPKFSFWVPILMCLSLSCGVFLWIFRIVSLITASLKP